MAAMTSPNAGLPKLLRAWWVDTYLEMAFPSLNQSLHQKGGGECTSTKWQRGEKCDTAYQHHFYNGRMQEMAGLPAGTGAWQGPGGRVPAFWAPTTTPSANAPGARISLPEFCRLLLQIKNG